MRLSIDRSYRSITSPRGRWNGWFIGRYLKAVAATDTAVGHVVTVVGIWCAIWISMWTFFFSDYAYICCIKIQVSLVFLLLFLYWLVVWDIFYFPIYWVSNHPNWRTHIFQRGVFSTTNQTSIFTLILIYLAWRLWGQSPIFLPFAVQLDRNHHRFGSIRSDDSKKLDHAVPCRIQKGHGWFISWKSS